MTLGERPIPEAEELVCGRVKVVEQLRLVGCKAGKHGPDLYGIRRVGVIERLSHIALGGNKVALTVFGQQQPVIEDHASIRYGLSRVITTAALENHTAIFDIASSAYRLVCPAGCVVGADKRRAQGRVFHRMAR